MCLNQYLHYLFFCQTAFETTQSSDKAAFTLAPWVSKQQLEILLFVVLSPKEPRQVQSMIGALKTYDLIIKFFLQLTFLQCHFVIEYRATYRANSNVASPMVTIEIIVYKQRKTW